MSVTQLIKIKWIFGATFLTFAFSLFGCSAPAIKPTTDLSRSTHKYQVAGDTYTDLTHNVQFRVPNKNWSIEPKEDTRENTIPLVGLSQDVYHAYAILVVSKHPQKNLQEFANVGVYNPNLAKFTYIAGKPAYFATKPMQRSGFNLINQIYKFVNQNTGYIFSVSFLDKWREDEQLLAEIDDILNSLTFMEQGVVFAEGSVTGKSENSAGKLTDVAIMDLVDLYSKTSTQKTQILTNDLQEQLSQTGRFNFVERRNLDSLLKEQAIQMSGVVSDQSAIKIGSMLGAKYLISGNLGKIDETTVIYVQITNCENGKVLGTASARCRRCSDDMLLNSIPVLVSKLSSSF